MHDQYLNLIKRNTGLSAGEQRHTLSIFYERLPLPSHCVTSGLIYIIYM